MDLYGILNLSCNATKLDIKKSHYLLTKTLTHKITEKERLTVKTINYAFEILFNQKEKYDNLSFEQKVDFNIFINLEITNPLIIKYLIPNYLDYQSILKDKNNCNQILENLTNVLEQSSILQVFNYFIDKNILDQYTCHRNNLPNFLSTTVNEKKQIINEFKCDFFKPPVLNRETICLNLKIDIKDVYDNKMKTLKVKRKIDDIEEILNLKFSLLKPFIVFQGWGDINDNSFGDIIISLEYINDNMVIDGYDIIYTYVTTVENLLRQNYRIDYFGKKITIKDFNPLNNEMKYIFENKGILINPDINKKRGDLIIKFNVDNSKI